MGIIAALYQRVTTGRGQHIQIAMRDAMLNYCRTPMSRQAAREDQLPRGGNTVPGTAPGGLYKCSPGGSTTGATSLPRGATGNIGAA
jgi:formyl-CoA transferase